MSQIIVAKNIHGIILVAENRALQLNESGKRYRYKSTVSFL